MLHPFTPITQELRMAAVTTGRPMADEYAPFYAGYVGNVVEIDPVQVMESQAANTQSVLGAITESHSLFRYAPDKWSIREMAGHLGDAERIFAYRALRIGRGDATPMEGFDEDSFVRGGQFDRRTLADLAAELAALRRSTVALFRGFDATMWNQRGIANNVRVSVRALGFIIPGHERHHMKVLKERYTIEGT